MKCYYIVHSAYCTYTKMVFSNSSHSGHNFKLYYVRSSNTNHLLVIMRHFDLVAGGRMSHSD